LLSGFINILIHPIVSAAMFISLMESAKTKNENKSNAIPKNKIAYNKNGDIKSLCKNFMNGFKSIRKPSINKKSIIRIVPKICILENPKKPFFNIKKHEFTKITE
jgi:hypothetical protein